MPHSSSELKQKIRKMRKIRNREYWDTIKGIGKLYIETILVYGNEPALFVCAGENKQRYLFMAYNSYESKYIFVKSDIKALSEIILGKYSIEKAFRNADKICQTREDRNGSLTYDVYDPAGFPAEKLPDPEIMFEAMPSPLCHRSHILPDVKKIAPHSCDFSRE